MAFPELIYVHGQCWANNKTDVLVRRSVLYFRDYYGYLLGKHYVIGLKRACVHLALSDLWGSSARKTRPCIQGGRCVKCAFSNGQDKDTGGALHPKTGGR